MGKKLFVGNLSFNTTSESLKEIFASVGTVESATVMNDRMTGRSRGFGFVEMSTPDEANRAVSEIHGREYDGRNINVSEARERTPGGGGSFGGGGGGGGFNRSFGGFQNEPPPSFRKDGGSRRGLRGRKRSL